jgi:hypothetical protein
MLVVGQVTATKVCTSVWLEQDIISYEYVLYAIHAIKSKVHYYLQNQFKVSTQSNQV